MIVSEAGGKQSGSSYTPVLALEHDDIFDARDVLFDTRDEHDVLFDVRGLLASRLLTISLAEPKICSVESDTIAVM